jgi:hypothetical protein
MVGKTQKSVNTKASKEDRKYKKDYVDNGSRFYFYNTIYGQQ